MKTHLLISMASTSKKSTIILNWLLFATRYSLIYVVVWLCVFEIERVV